MGDRRDIARTVAALPESASARETLEGMDPPPARKVLGAEDEAGEASGRPSLLRRIAAALLRLFRRLRPGRREPGA